MITDRKRTLLDHFAEGRERYKLAQFHDAQRCFTRALKIDPNDGPSKVYYARCKHYIQHPPATDWDGVFVKAFR